MATKNYDFSGWATRNDIRCSDGRTIRKNAFKAQDGTEVPLIWGHRHDDPEYVMGHALLENRDQGVYAYCSFNNTERGREGKELVQHGDIRALSIYANQLKQNGGDVIHGAIREVSLVLAGANPGAYIEDVVAHSDNSDEGYEATIYNPDQVFEFAHSAENVDVLKPALLNVNTNPKEKSKMDNENRTPENAGNEETVQDVFDTLTDKQKTVVYALIGQALENEKNKAGNTNGTNMEDSTVKHNAFDTESAEPENYISHADILDAIKDAKKTGSMKEAFLAHGITNIESLFPEAQAVNKTPEIIDRDTTWVSKVMNGVHHTPFSRVKSTAANITADEARAKGYIKGNKKAEEVITALKRTTTPTTIYKLQKMDRDDVIDITDYDVIAWIKQEMRGKLDEEAARAILIGDGRDSSSDDHIPEANIRPILGDNSTYTVAKILERADGADDSAYAKYFIQQVIKSRKDYKGSGNPTLFTTEDMLTNMLLIEDKNGRVIYDTEEKLKTALRVKEIVTVEVMENHVRTDDTNTYDYTLDGILVNLQDYNVGADKGGAVNMFDDFDIDYNKYSYLIETRFSGALVKPFSAITFEEKTKHSA
jgi:HK97 family phage prohead protease